MRDIDPELMAAYNSGLIRPVLMVMLTFKSASKYIWSGAGPLVWNGNTYTGVGSLGQIDTITEGLGEPHADGTTVQLSGIDPTLLGECLTDIEIGAPAEIRVGLLDGNGNLLGTPYLRFRGQVDSPAFKPGVDELTVALHLESRMVNLNRASYRRYTAEDQNARYPTETAFKWVPVLQDIALQWNPR